MDVLAGVSMSEHTVEQLLHERDPSENLGTLKRARRTLTSPAQIGEDVARRAIRMDGPHDRRSELRVITQFVHGATLTQMGLVAPVRSVVARRVDATCTSVPAPWL